MGNEYGAADFQPHLIYGLTLHKKYDATSTATVTVIAGGYHPKMRLRYATVMVVDAALSVADVDVDVYHGGNLVAETVVTGAVDSPIGDVTEITIVDQYKDLAADEALIILNTAASTTGDLLFFFEYELVE